MFRPRQTSSAIKPCLFPTLTLLLCSQLACFDSKEEESSCAELMAQDCQPSYEPVFERVFTQTLEQRCQGPGCHGGPDLASYKGGIRVAEIEETYSMLLESGAVIPGDAACSPLVFRLEGGGRGFMPPVTPLSAGERCAIQMWIAEGAPR